MSSLTKVEGVEEKKGGEKTTEDRRMEERKKGDSI